jgi:uncharacterized membrane protein
MAFGGVDVRERMALVSERTREIVRVVVSTTLFILLFTLVTGIWACLWVPPF